MKRTLALLLALSFTLWVLPLGVFIKPSREKMACDGQRAICMCHAIIPKPPDKAMEAGVALKAGPSTNKENPSGGAGSYFVSAKPTVTLNISFTSFFQNQHFCYKNPYLARPEYVPKF